VSEVGWLMKDNRGITLIELVVAIAILSTILLSIYSFYIVGVKGYTRETTSAYNQMSVRKVLRDVEREIRRAKEIELFNNLDSDNYRGIRLTDNDGTITEFVYNTSSNKITKTIDGDVMDNWADRIDSFKISTEPSYLEVSGDNPIRKIVVTIGSVESADMSSSGGKKESLETVIAIRK